ncbi:MAG: hypothetical protein GY817_00075 [bacterium]|nr:hypothetical protein [bacterium]
MIFKFFTDIAVMGIIFGLTTTFTTCSFMIPYMIAQTNNAKQALHSILFLFLGRLLAIMILAGLSVNLTRASFIIYFYETKIFDYLAAFFAMLIIISAFLRLKSKLQYYWLFFIGFFLGLQPNTTFKIFLTNLNLTVINKFLALTSGFVFGLMSFINLLLILAIFIGNITRFTKTTFPSLHVSIVRIATLVIIYLGLERLFKVWISI